MFDRFTDAARYVVVLAQEEARMLDHDFIGAEHLLLGVVAENDGVGARALESMGVSLGAARARVAETVGRGQPPPTGRVPIPFTPGAKRVLEFAMREAHQLGHDHIDTEHILLGLVREGEGVADVLGSLDVEPDGVRRAVQLFSG